jgi:predicted nucleotidyltransferase
MTESEEASGQAQSAQGFALNRTMNELTASFATLESVEALVVAGSTATGLTDRGSDYDLYAYTREAVPVEFRAKLLKPRAARLELHNTFWE